MLSRISLVIAMLLLWQVRVASAQEESLVRVNTNLPEAILYVDSLLVGTVTGEFVSVPASARELRVTAPEVNSWSISPLTREVKLSPGDSMEVHMNFPHYYRIESIPFGASVHHEKADARTLLGSTPLTYLSEEPLSGMLAVERPGYSIERLEPGKKVWNRYVIGLKPMDEPDPTKAQVHWQPPRKRNAWIDYAAIGTALAAGIVAVHYKFKADDLYSQYEDTADQSLRPQIRDYDVKSGIAFGVMQGGLGLFAIRLALR